MSAGVAEAAATQQRTLEAGDAEGALLALLRDLVNMPPAEIELLRAQTAGWERRLANAHTLLRELSADAAYVFEPERFKAMATPTLFLVGGASPARELKNARSVAAALPNARVAVLAEQQHVAMDTAPDLFVRRSSIF